MMINKYLTTILISFFLIQINNSQDLDDLLEEATGSSTEYTIATFKSTRIVSGHSVEQMKTGQLDFRIAHRFGQLNTGSYNLWGLDEAHIHFGFDYGITNWLMIGVGRGTYEKTFDGLIKFSVLKQSKGDRIMPVSLNVLSTMAMGTIDWYKPGEEFLLDRLSFVHQLLVARKFNDRLSLEVNPTFVHRNLVATALDPNDLYAVGAGGRFKLTKRVTVNAEYYYVVPPVNDYRSQKTYNPLSLGFDIETGGHVFQVHITNSLAMIEKGFIGETTGRWIEGDLHIGFNISRVFALY